MRNLMIAAFLAAPVMAQQALSLQDAIQLALKQHPSLEAGRSGVNAADTRIRQARSAYLPKVNYSETVLRTNNPVVVFSSLLTQHQFTEQNFMLGPLNRPEALNNFQSQVTVDQVVYHTKAVARRTSRAHLVADMPFGSYQGSEDDAVKNACRLVAEGGAEAVKLEGGADFAGVIRKIVRAGIPVMGHIGLTPQAVHKMGGYVVQGRDEERAERLYEDALALEAAGCYSLVLEGIPMELAERITAALKIPTIGIGAGPGCDGQVLVIYDMLGMDPSFSPKFVKRFADLHRVIGEAVGQYLAEVKSGEFPALAQSFRSAKVHVVEGGAELNGLYGGASAKAK